MRPLTWIAIGLIALGLVAFAYEGISYTTRDKTLDIGPLHVTTEKTHHIPLPPIAGAITLLVGCGLLVMNRKRLGGAVAR
jgi:hypothetical protein